MGYTIVLETLIHDAVYWPPSTQSDAYGKPVNSNPVPLKVRWEDQTIETVDHMGRLWISKSMVYVPINVLVGGILYRGKTTDPGFNATTPFDNPGAFEIKRIEKNDSYTGEATIRLAIL